MTDNFNLALPLQIIPPIIPFGYKPHSFQPNGKYWYNLDWTAELSDHQNHRSALNVYKSSSSSNK